MLNKYNSGIDISIIIPAYNAEIFIQELLDSILAQSHKNYEVICVDDGSTDGTPEILDSIGKKDKRFIVVHQKNKGASAARNAGIRMARGEYLYIIDSDDCLLEDSIEILVEEAKKYNSDIVYGDFYLQKDKKRKYTHVFSQVFHTNDMRIVNALHYSLNSAGFAINTHVNKIGVINDFGGAPWRAMIKRSIVVENKVEYDESLRGLGEDILFMQNLYEYVRSVSYIDKPVYCYRIQDSSLSHGFKKDVIGEYLHILSKEEEYLVSKKKESIFWKVYYLRVLHYINLSMNSYFFNPDNVGTKHLRYAEFKKMISQEPFRTAGAKAPLCMAVGIKTKLLYMLLRFKCNRAYWLIKSYKLK